MAERLGRDADAEHWFSEGLQYAGDDFYTRTAYADLLLRHGRDAETLRLLGDYRSMEPMLLRVAIAEKRTARPPTQPEPTHFSPTPSPSKSSAAMPCIGVSRRGFCSISSNSLRKHWPPRRKTGAYSGNRTMYSSCCAPRRPRTAPTSGRSGARIPAPGKARGRATHSLPCELNEAPRRPAAHVAAGRGRPRRISPAVAFWSFTSQGQTLSGSLEIALRDAELAVGVDANHDGKITWGELRASEPRLERYVAQHLVLSAPGLQNVLDVPATAGERARRR